MSSEICVATERPIRGWARCTHHVDELPLATGFTFVVCQGLRASLRSAMAAFCWSSIDAVHLSLWSKHDCSGPQVVTVYRSPELERLILFWHT